jgi:hypothetical protein
MIVDGLWRLDERRVPTAGNAPSGDGRFGDMTTLVTARNWPSEAFRSRSSLSAPCVIAHIPGLRRVLRGIGTARRPGSHPVATVLLLATKDYLLGRGRWNAELHRRQVVREHLLARRPVVGLVSVQAACLASLCFGLPLASIVVLDPLRQRAAGAKLVTRA